jgi:glycosyltransferase involved in cell wall biosynthesis
VRQTYENIEIIVSDNHSSDHTEFVVKEFGDSRIRYYRQKENIGPVSNRNFCLEQARGKYIVMLLDDDLIDEDFLSTCMSEVKGREPGVIFTGVREIDSEGNVISSCKNTVGGYSTADFILGWFDRKVPLYLCSTVFNTQRLKELGGIHSKTNRYDDVVAYVQLAAKYGRVDIPDVKASFRRHGSNIGRAVHYSVWCEDSLYLLETMCNAVPEHAHVIRKRGMPYFSVRNYNRVAEITPLTDRFHAYLTIYRTFEYCYSPLRFLYVRNLFRIVKLWKGTIASRH